MLFPFPLVLSAMLVVSPNAPARCFAGNPTLRCAEITAIVDVMAQLGVRDSAALIIVHDAETQKELEMQMPDKARWVVCAQTQSAARHQRCSTADRVVMMLGTTSSRVELGQVYASTNLTVLNVDPDYSGSLAKLPDASIKEAVSFHRDYQRVEQGWIYSG